MRWLRRLFALLFLSLSVALPGPLAAQERVVTGRVLDEVTRAPVAFASVSVVGTAIGAVSDQSGAFRLDGVPGGPVTLRVQSLGYRTRQVGVPSGQDEVEIALPTDYLNVEAIVVTGRATEVERRNLGNSVATVTAQEIERVPAQSLEKQLQGKVAGADIQKNSGAPGGGIQVDLRGIASINATSEPLYVVDGVIISNVAIPNNQDIVTRASIGSNTDKFQTDQVNRVADLNPNDIETIEILRGASASAIYGSKASNGVVIITTKTGRPGPPRVDITQRFGVFDLSNKLDFLTYENATEEQVVGIFGEAAREPFRQGRFFDHEEELAGQNDLSTETVVSVSGGDENTTYYASGLVKNDEGIIENTGYENQSLRVNLGQRFGDRLMVNIYSNLIHSLAQRGLANNDNALVSFYMALPFIPRFHDLRQRPDGTFPASPFGGASNPLQTAALMENDEDVWRVLGAVDLTYDVWRGQNQSLQLVSNGGVDWLRQKNDLFFPPELHFEPLDGLAGTSLLTNADNLNLNGGVNLVHAFHAGGGWSATTSAGFQYEDRDIEIARVVSQNLTAGQPNVDAGTQIQVSERRERVEDFGFYVQEELLLLDDRLALVGGVRAEQSSANGDTEKLFYYPKASAAYTLTAPVARVDELKLRLAYGESGNQPLFGQKFISLDATRNIGGNPGLVVNPETGDPTIEPERTREIEGGIDATLFDGNAVLELTGYQQNIENLILEREVAPSSGFDTQFFNGGELRVRGFEAALAVTPFRREDLLWISRTTFGLDRSEVTDLPVPTFVFGVFGASLGTFQIEEGESATQIVGSTIEGDIVKGGDANPDFKMAFVNDVTWRDWNFYMLWDWQKGGDIINLMNLIADLAQTTNDFIPAGQARLQGLSDGDGSVFIEDASFVKLREATLAYELPGDLVDRLWPALRRVRVSLSGRDLLTFTDYSGIDPEVSNFGNKPIARNVDVAPFPPSRSFWLSIDLGF
jgi:TonB-linked SusC/RagA family outer membrane protein